MSMVLRILPLEFFLFFLYNYLRVSPTPTLNHIYLRIIFKSLTPIKIFSQIVYLFIQLITGQEHLDDPRNILLHMSIYRLTISATPTLNPPRKWVLFFKSTLSEIGMTYSPISCPKQTWALFLSAFLSYSCENISVSLWNLLTSLYFQGNLTT